MQHRAYIAMNPVKAGLVDSPEKYPYCFEFLANKKSGAKHILEEAQSSEQTAAGAKALDH